jgi:DNA-binding response OmpR family regulator
MTAAGSPARRVLVVDDEIMVRNLVCRLLALEGYEVFEAEDGQAAIDLVRKDEPDLVILDVMLPSRDGLDVLSELRRTTNVPIILVSARGGEADRVVGLKMGADDYVVKPFSAAELSARIESVLRRTQAARPSKATTASARRLVFAGLEIDLDTREVVVKGRTADTTAKEFDLLAFLAASPRQVFSREQLLEHVWSSSSDWQSEATVTEHIRRLRRKIEDDPDRPRWVTTARGVGYRFEP